jgi:hypothetical protein
METKTKPEEPRILDKAELRRLMDEVNRQTGFVAGADVTLEELHARQIAAGVRPEECGASRELYRMRYGDNWEEDWPEV